MQTSPSEVIRCKCGVRLTDYTWKPSMKKRGYRKCIYCKQKENKAFQYRRKHPLQSEISQFIQECSGQCKYCAATDNLYLCPSDTSEIESIDHLLYKHVEWSKTKPENLHVVCNRCINTYSIFGFEIF